MKQSAAMLAGAGLAGTIPHTLMASERKVAPSDTIRIGAIGINGMGCF